jgi:hypothetical protein
MSRSSMSEFERRVDEVYDLLVSRVTWRVIVSFCTAKWGVSERQACRYMAAARERIRELLGPSQSEHLAKALASYEALYAKQVAGAHYGEARATLDSIVKLLGLAAPDKLEVYDFSGYSDKQLAEEVARELPGLISEAERLTRRTGPQGTPEDERPDTLGPPHPDAQAG